MKEFFKLAEKIYDTLRDDIPYSFRNKIFILSKKMIIPTQKFMIMMDCDIDGEFCIDRDDFSKINTVGLFLNIKDYIKPITDDHSFLSYKSMKKIINYDYTNQHKILLPQAFRKVKYVISKNDNLFIMYDNNGLIQSVQREGDSDLGFTNLTRIFDVNMIFQLFGGKQSLVSTFGNMIRISSGNMSLITTFRDISQDPPSCTESTDIKRDLKIFYPEI